jgi:hypothetical protein
VKRPENFLFDSHREQTFSGISEWPGNLYASEHEERGLLRCTISLQQMMAFATNPFGEFYNVVFRFNQRAKCLREL